MQSTLIAMMLLFGEFLVSLNICAALTHISLMIIPRCLRPVLTL